MLCLVAERIRQNVVSHFSGRIRKKYRRSRKASSEDGGSMNERMKEIRRILMGRFTYEYGGAAIVATRNPLKIQSDGMFFGVDGIRLLGLCVHSRQYKVLGDPEEAQNIYVRAMLKYGKQALLLSAPNTLAVLHYPVAANPELLTLDAKGDRLLYCIYTAKSPLAKNRANKMFEKWENGLSDILAATDTETPHSGSEPDGKKRRDRKKTGQIEEEFFDENDGE